MLYVRCDIGIYPHIITDWYGTSLSTAYFQVKKVMKVYYSKPLRKEKKIFSWRRRFLSRYMREANAYFLSLNSLADHRVCSDSTP